MRNSPASINTEKALASPLSPPRKVDSYQLFEEFEERVTKLHLPENWQINSLSKYSGILEHYTIDIPIFDIYNGNNLEFTNQVFGVCIPANHETYMKIRKYVKKTPPYQIWLKKLVISAFLKVLKKKKKN